MINSDNEQPVNEPDTNDIASSDTGDNESDKKDSETENDAEKDETDKSDNIDESDKKEESADDEKETSSKTDTSSKDKTSSSSSSTKTESNKTNSTSSSDKTSTSSKDKNTTGNSSTSSSNKGNTSSSGDKGTSSDKNTSSDKTSTSSSDKNSSSNKNTSSDKGNTSTSGKETVVDDGITYIYEDSSHEKYTMIYPDGTTHKRDNTKATTHYSTVGGKQLIDMSDYVPGTEYINADELLAWGQLFKEPADGSYVYYPGYYATYDEAQHVIDTELYMLDLDSPYAHKSCRAVGAYDSTVGYRIRLYK